MLTLVELDGGGWALFDGWGHYLGSYRVFSFADVCADVARLQAGAAV